MAGPALRLALAASAAVLAGGAWADARAGHSGAWQVARALLELACAAWLTWHARRLRHATFAG